RPQRWEEIMLTAGQPFPNFSLPNQDAKMVSLADFAGRWLVVYVYPKDDTPGCTIQGKAFSASKDDFDRANAAVVGLNQDDVGSHKSFCDKFGFRIDLLSDRNAQLLTALGVKQSDWHGTMYWDRTTFLVDPHGTVRKVYEHVKPDGHDRMLLNDINAMR